MQEENKPIEKEELPEELSASIFEDDRAQQEMDRYTWEASVRKGRNALFVVAILILISELISAARDNMSLDGYTWAFILIASGVFFALAIIANRTKPYTTLMIGLIVFILYILAVAILNTMVDGAEGFFKAIFSGILIKGAVIYYLVKSLNGAKRMQEYYERTTYDYDN